MTATTPPTTLIISARRRSRGLRDIRSSFTPAAACRTTRGPFHLTDLGSDETEHEQLDHQPGHRAPLLDAEDEPFSGAERDVRDAELEKLWRPENTA